MKLASSADGPAFASAMRGVLGERPARRRELLGATQAAVLIGLFEGREGVPHVWLVLRPKELRTHAGQVALPGGKKDPEDVDLVRTALREAEEEIGLASSDVEVLGVADDLATPTGYVITPVVGWIAAPFAPRPNPTEVSRAFAAPLAIFRDSRLVELIPYEPLKRIVRAFRVEGEVVWGATAAILTALAERAPLGDRRP